jgi:hypothetical protein
VLDSLQLTTYQKCATPANWVQGGKVLKVCMCVYGHVCASAYVPFRHAYIYTGSDVSRSVSFPPYSHKYILLRSACSPPCLTRRLRPTRACRSTRRLASSAWFPSLSLPRLKCALLLFTCKLCISFVHGRSSSQFLLWIYRKVCTFSQCSLQFCLTLVLLIFA